MAYDEVLAHRIREQLSGTDAVTEKAMFGGLGFMVDGRMAVAASHTGAMLARIDANDGDQLTTAEGVERMVMNGREMKAWLHVEPEHLEADGDLAAWVERGVAAARAAA